MKMQKLIKELTEIIQEKRGPITSNEYYFEGFYKAGLDGATLFDCIMSLNEEDVNNISSLEYCSILFGYALGQSYQKYGRILSNKTN